MSSLKVSSFYSIRIHYKICFLLHFVKIILHNIQIINQLAGAEGLEPSPGVLEAPFYGFAYHYSFHYQFYCLWSGLYQLDIQVWHLVSTHLQSKVGYIEKCTALIFDLLSTPPILHGIDSLCSLLYFTLIQLGIISYPYFGTLDFLRKLIRMIFIILFRFYRICHNFHAKRAPIRRPLCYHYTKLAFYYLQLYSKGSKKSENIQIKHLLF